MGIYIKGMEMPKNCFLCKLSFMSGERLFCSAMKNEEVLRSKIDSSCPLIELPPHYDLIDHNALKIAVMNGDCETRIDFLKHVMDCINKAPVVIPSDIQTFGAEEGET